ncbi:MAG: hypothetical protein ABIU29_08850 [Chthoniobacterales bacterium]
MEPTPLDYDSPSEPLLLAIKARLEELAALLEKVSSHWHAEDAFYRFYHQSWKLYYLQGDTIEIVEKLRELWPEKQLHSWFEQIVREGTGLEFSFEDNRDWLCRGRPILEAFFHARTMLELAVKYGRELEHAPRMMPSGWAALLELYSARYDFAAGESEAATPAAPQTIDPKKASDERFR